MEVWASEHVQNDFCKSHQRTFIPTATPVKASVNIAENSNRVGARTGSQGLEFHFEIPDLEMVGIFIFMREGREKVGILHELS